ncbi:MAG: PhzF family phenazine biosynthesis protein [Cyclobacteriaceae bacterium]
MLSVLDITQVDAFAERAFCGNPAAVCVLPEMLPDTVLQQIANEMNLSETAYLLRRENDYHLRWFTPTTEVELCGHATLASAHVLWEKGLLKADEEAVFHTMSGKLTAWREGEKIIMDFPAWPAQKVEVPEVARLFGNKTVFIGKNDFDYLVVLPEETDVIMLRPDFQKMSAIDCRGFIVTARSNNQAYDFISRYFTPAYGVNEDPVTGSAHCCLGHYWANKLGKDELTGYQASARGGYVGTQLKGERIWLKGSAVSVMEGRLKLR